MLRSSHQNMHGNQLQELAQYVKCQLLMCTARRVLAQHIACKRRSQIPFESPSWCYKWNISHVCMRRWRWQGGPSLLCLACSPVPPRAQSTPQSASDAHYFARSGTINRRPLSRTSDPSLLRSLNGSQKSECSFVGGLRGDCVRGLLTALDMIAGCDDRAVILITRYHNSDIYQNEWHQCDPATHMWL